MPLLTRANDPWANTFRKQFFEAHWESEVLVAKRFLEDYIFSDFDTVLDIMREFFKSININLGPMEEHELVNAVKIVLARHKPSIPSNHQQLSLDERA